MARKGPAAPARARAAVVMNRPAGCQSLCGRGGTRQTHKVESLAVNSHGGSIPPDRTKIRRDGGTGRRTGLRTQHPVRGIGVQIPFPVPRQAAKRIRRCQLPPRKNRLQACGSVVMAAEHGSEPCGRDTVRVRLPPSAPRLRPCRNWQTGGPQKPVWETTWRFDASRPHQDLPQWRNRQTHTAQTRMPSKAWGFDSPLRHQARNRLSDFRTCRSHRFKERWPSGLRRWFAKPEYGLNPVPWVRIPPSPPFQGRTRCVGGNWL